MLMIKPAVFPSTPLLLNVTRSSPPFQFPTSNAATLSTQSLKFRVSSSPNPTVEVAPSNIDAEEEELESGADIVRKFYDQLAVGHVSKTDKKIGVHMTLVNERVAQSGSLAKASEILAFDLVQGALVSLLHSLNS